MRNSIIRTFVLAALVGVVGATASPTAVQARFHLAVTAHWGQAVLAPGDYKITVGSAGSSRGRVVIEGAGNTMYAMPVATDPEQMSKASSLRLVEHEGVYFVREYRSGAMGKTFTFGVPKEFGRGGSKSVELAN